jgi:hypothetical protein
VPLATAVVYVRRCCSRTFDVRAQTFDRDQRLTVTPSNISKLPETELASDQSSIRAVSTTVCTDQIPLTYLLATAVSRLQRMSNCHGHRHRYELISIYSSTTVRTVRVPYLFTRSRLQRISNCYGRCHISTSTIDTNIFLFPVSP